MNGIVAALNALYKNLKTISIFIVIIHRAIFLLKTMDCYCIAGVVIFILLIAAVMIVIKRDSINGFFSKDSKGEIMVGGAKKRSRVKYTKHESKLSNIHHNNRARYIFIYLSDIYPKGLQEGSKFKSIMNQIKYKNEAYAVYERPCNGQWVDNLNIDDAWEDFKRKYSSEFNKEIDNGARLVFIGKGFGSIYAKIFMSASKKEGHYNCMAIALNGIHLREFIPALILEHLGLQDINVNDITFTDTKCIYKGTDYLKVFKISPKLYTLLFACDSLPTSDYFSFYGIDGTKTVEILPFNIVYDNTYLVKYGNKFTINDWLKIPKLLEAVIKESV